MKRYRVSFRPAAERDLIDLYEYVAREAGLQTAGSFIGRIEEACFALQSFPERITGRGYHAGSPDNRI